EEFRCDDRGRCPGNFDPLGFVSDRDCTLRSACPAVAVLLCLRPSVDRLSSVCLVEQHPANRQWIPLAATERRDALVVEFASKPVTTGAVSEPREDGSHGRCLCFVHRACTSSRVIPIAKHPSTGRLR